MSFYGNCTSDPVLPVQVSQGPQVQMQLTGRHNKEFLRTLQRRVCLSGHSGTPLIQYMFICYKIESSRFTVTYTNISSTPTARQVALQLPILHSFSYSLHNITRWIWT